MNNKHCKWKKAAKIVGDKKILDQALIDGKIIPLVKNPQTGQLQRFRVTSIDGEELMGHFLNS